MKHWIWKTSGVKTKFEAFIYLLLSAKFKDDKEPFGRDLIMLKRGQVLTSQEKLSIEWRWNRSAVRAFIDMLQKDSMITSNTTNKYTVITICNYDSYNIISPTKGPQTNIKRTSNEHQMNTDNNVNKDNNGKNNTYMGVGQKNGELKKSYTELAATFEGQEEKQIFVSLKQFIETHRPYFPDPYIDAWNIIAAKYGLPIVKTSTYDRQQKIKTRSQEAGFDFFRILESIRKNKNYQGDNSSGWKVDFNYIIASEKNYISIIEKLTV